MFLNILLELRFNFFVSREGTKTSLTNEDLEEFIDEDVVINVLKWYISATNEVELRRHGSLRKLIMLVRETFRIHWRGKNIEQVKTLDSITKNMHILSRSGKNITNSLIIK